jgi:hypothetical protein
MKINDQGQSSGSNFEPVRPSSNCQHAYNKKSGIAVNCVSDDSEDKISEPQTIPASRTSIPEESAINVQPSCKAQQTESPFQSSKRGFEDSIEDRENQGAKRWKASRSSSSLPVSSPDNRNDSGGIVTYDITSEMVTNLMRAGEPSYQNHALQDYQLQLMLLEQQNKKRLMLARQESAEHDSTGGCKSRDGQDCPSPDQSDETYQAGGINNDISSVSTDSTIQAHYESAQDEQSFGATSTILGVGISANSQSFSVTAPGTAVPPMQPESTGPSQRTTPAVQIDKAYESTISGPASSPTAPINDAPRIEAQQFSKEQDFPTVTQYPRRRSTTKSIVTGIDQPISGPQYNPQNFQLQQPLVGASQETDIQSRWASSPMSPRTSQSNVQQPPQRPFYTATPYYNQPPYRPPSGPLVAGHQYIPIAQFNMPGSLQQHNPSPRPQMMGPSCPPINSPSPVLGSNRPLPVALSNTQGFQQPHTLTPAAMRLPSYTPHHSQPVLIPSTSGSSQFEFSPQSPTQWSNQQVPFHNSMLPQQYPHGVFQQVFRLETSGNGQAMPNPLPDSQRSVNQQQFPSAPPYTQVPPRKASEVADQANNQPMPIYQPNPKEYPQQSQSNPALVVSVPHYTDVRWLEDSKFICHFFKALAAGQFSQYADLINAVDYGMASGYLWCSGGIDETWEIILRAKESPLRSRQDFEHLLNRWRKGPVVFIRKSPLAPSKSISISGVGTQDVQMSDASQVVISPARGPALYTEPEVCIKRQTELPMILLDLLKSTQDIASQWLLQIPQWLQNLRFLKDSVPRDEEALQARQEQVDTKQAEIDTLEAKYEDLAQMLPEAQREELQQVREKTKLTMQRDLQELNRHLEECSRVIQEKRARIEKLEGCMRGLKSATPEAIEALKAFVTQLPDL